MADRQIIYRGADESWDLSFTETDENDVSHPINLTGATIDVVAATLPKPAVVVTDPANGKVTASLTSQQTAGLVRGSEQWFQMRITYSPTEADVFPPVRVLVQ